MVIALVGDGAMQMNGMNELITIGKYWQRWSDPRLIVMVLNNRDLNQVTWEQRATEGDPKFDASQDLPDFPYASYAELIGLHGIRVDQPEILAAAWDFARSVLTGRSCWKPVPIPTYRPFRRISRLNRPERTLQPSCAAIRILPVLSGPP